MSLPGFCGCGFCSALSLTLPFTLALPVLPLHAVSRGGGSVGARAPVAHSNWGGSELREATHHPGKSLCQSACLSFSLVAFLSRRTCSSVFLFSGYLGPLIVTLFLFLSSPLSFLHCVVSLSGTSVCCSSTAHLPFGSHSPTLTPRFTTE